MDNAIENTGKSVEGDGQPMVTETLEHLDPATLLCDRNIAADRKADPILVASVRDLGVLTPVNAVRTADGAVRLRMGYRRRDAAIAAGLPTIKVVVAQATGSVDDPEAAEEAIERLVGQWAENEHRAGLDATARVEAMAQMALLGLSTDQIAARTHVAREHAAAAVKVAGSDVARRALAKRPDLDLTQAAVLAEFEDDLEAAERLYAAAQNGRFAHVAAAERERRAMNQAKHAARSALAERGIPVIDEPYWGDQAAPLHRLLQDGEPITAAAHRSCLGRAAYLATAYTQVQGAERVDLSALAEEEPQEQHDGEQTHANTSGKDEDAYQHEDNEDKDEDDDADRDEGGDEDGDEDDVRGDWQPHVEIVRVRWACTDPQAHGHTDTRPAPARTTTTSAQVDPEAERAAKSAERRRVITNNSAWRVAEPVRRDFIRALLTRKTAPKGAAAFIATVTAQHTAALSHHNASALAADLLGAAALPTGRWHQGTAKAAAALAKVSEARALVIALGTCLAACEANTSRNDWRSEEPTTRLLLCTLAGWGYERSDVERLACGEQPLAATADEADQADQAAIDQPDEPDQDAEAA